MNIICFLLGLQAAVILFLLYVLRNGMKLNKHVPPVLTDDEATEREHQAEKAKQIKKHFQALMDYDVDKALERKYEGG